MISEKSEGLSWYFLLSIAIVQNQQISVELLYSKRK